MLRKGALISFTAPISTSCLHVSGTNKERADPTVLKPDGWKGAKIFEGKKEESVTRPMVQRLPGVGLPVKLQYIKGSSIWKLSLNSQSTEPCNTKKASFSFFF